MVRLLLNQGFVLYTLQAQTASKVLALPESKNKLSKPQWDWQLRPQSAITSLRIF